MDAKKKRTAYIVSFIVLLILEVIIALFIHDSFVRPYLGDIIVVILLYCFIRMFIPEKCKFMPLFVFAFAVGVEFLQLYDVVDRLGLGNIEFFKILAGSVFDLTDIMCYAVGCVLLGFHEFAVRFDSWKKQ